MEDIFLGAFVSRCTLKTPALTARKHTCGSLRLRLHEPHVANLTAARFTFAVFCSGHTLFLIYQQGGMEAGVELVRSGIEPGPPARMSEHVSERLTL